jgi:hypothetical protein
MTDRVAWGSFTGQRHTAKPPAVARTSDHLTLDKDLPARRMDPGSRAWNSRRRGCPEELEEAL